MLELMMPFVAMIFRECTKILVSSHAAAPGGKLKAIYQKYTTVQFGCVALHPPAAVLGLA